MNNGPGRRPLPAAGLPPRRQAGLAAKNKPAERYSKASRIVFASRLPCRIRSKIARSGRCSNALGFVAIDCFARRDIPTRRHGLPPATMGRRRSAECSHTRGAPPNCSQPRATPDGDFHKVRTLQNEFHQHCEKATKTVSRGAPPRGRRRPSVRAPQNG
jgi:hypothetical protein